jgi:Fe-S-cluster-containing dehydrogenase component
MTEYCMSDEVKKQLLFDPAICTGCLNCVLACAQERSGFSGPGVGRLAIDLDLFGGPHDCIVCRQCDLISCVEACPNEAMVQSAATGAWVIDSEKCVGCLSCVEACTFDSLFVCSRSGLPLKCDLCEGSPACVEACAFEALRYGSKMGVADEL